MGACLTESEERVSRESENYYSSDNFGSDNRDAEICAKLDRIIELLEVQVGALVTAQEEADQPEEVDRGHLGS